MLARYPIRLDRGTRSGAQIMLQAVNPASNAPLGNPINFLAGNSNNFCTDGNCDFGLLSANHSGTALTFECRLSVKGESYLDRSWNICIAEIDAAGRAVNPRLLLPASQQQSGRIASRLDPFGIPEGLAQKGPYDKHFLIRNSYDSTPAFTPDDSAIVFAAQRADPFSGVKGIQTYHGEFVVDNIITADLNGQNLRTIYRNEGGTADLPFYLRNGNIAFHTWNLERMDRHLYVQSLADGMMENPVLGGRLQGQNMWGKAFQSNNGAIFGLTGRRRGEISNYAPFVFDHTMGIATTNSNFTEPGGFQVVPEGYLEELGDYPQGFCPDNLGNPQQASTTKNCFLSELMLDPSYLPDGRALIAYNPEKTYIGEGEDFFANYASGSELQQIQQSVIPWLPKKLGIGVIDQTGNRSVLLPNRAGMMMRYPVWVGSRQHPRIQTPVLNSSVGTELHIANFPLWLSFQEQGNGLGRKTDIADMLNTISAVRVLRKIADDGACIADDRYIRMANAESNGYHPTALGLNDATGFERLLVSVSAGGNAFGDIPLQSDASVKLKIPPSELLLYQGVNAAGEVVSQHSRVFALPGGHKVNTSVKADQYYAQCASCHGVVKNSQSVPNMYYTENLPAVMDFNTLANDSAAVDISSDNINFQELTYLAALRPILDQKCISCHAGETPSGGLSLQDTYSAIGNYPPVAWEASPITKPTYIAYMQGRTKVRSPNFSIAYGWLFNNDHPVYQNYFSSEIAEAKPLGELAPWDPGYQNLFRQQAEGDGLYYLNNTFRTAFGRVLALPANASRSFLIEILSGRNTDTGKSYSGYDHTSLLTQNELQTFMAVLDAGFPYMGRCGDKIIPSGPNAGQPWGSIE